MKRAELPKCSLIIATYNWPEALQACLNSIFAQTHLPQEILIADDGSTIATKSMIERISASSPVPIRHIWHPDKGFRLAEIRNKAIAASCSEYIVQIDGDILAEPNFIHDHLVMARENAFLCGSRVLLSPSLTQRILGQPDFRWSRLSLSLGYLLNSIRVPVLGRFLADRYKKNQLTALRGCNMSFWKSDLIMVNGYNTAITGWGSEDAELAIRLHNLGRSKRFLKFMGIAYHLFHPENDKSNLSENQEVQARAVREKITYIESGIIPTGNQQALK